MSTPRRFIKGVTNVPASENMGQLIITDPTAVTVWMEDFYRFNPNDWKVTRSDPSLAGGGAKTTGEGNLASTILDGYSSERIIDAAGGVLQIKTGTVDDANIFFQWKGDRMDLLTASGLVATRDDLPSENWTLTAGQKLWFKTRMKIDDEDTADWQIGLHTADTSPLASAPANGLYFQSDDADGFLDFTIRAASAATLADTALIDVVDDTYFTCGFYYDGGGKVEYFANDVSVGNATGITLPTTELAVSFGLQNGSSAQSTMSIDYICVVQERV